MKLKKIMHEGKKIGSAHVLKRNSKNKTPKHLVWNVNYLK